MFNRRCVIRALSATPQAVLVATGLGPGLLWPEQARAGAILSDALSAYREGRWREAANKARALRSADNLAFAARALLAGAMLNRQAPTRAADVAAARNLSEAAMALDALHVEGRLQLATALGLQARLVSPPRAFGQGLPQQALRLLQSVVRDVPDEAWGHALIGGWHLEGLRIGGPAARALLGANVGKGQQAFDRAMALDPAEPAIPFYYGISWLALNAEQNAAQARQLHARAAALAPRDAFQTEICNRAAQLSALLGRGETSQAVARALQWL